MKTPNGAKGAAYSMMYYIGTFHRMTETLTLVRESRLVSMCIAKQLVVTLWAFSWFMYLCVLACLEDLATHQCISPPASSNLLEQNSSENSE